MSRFKIKSQSPLKKKARRGFRGYPVATVAFYGPDNTRASKVAVGIITREDAEPDALERWFSEDGDVRKDPVVGHKILEFTQQHGAKTVVVTDSMLYGRDDSVGTLDSSPQQRCPEAPRRPGGPPYCATSSRDSSAGCSTRSACGCWP